MSPRKLSLFVLLLASVLAVVFLWAAREPSYHGRSLSEWLERAASAPLAARASLRSSSPAEPDPEAAAALRALAPQALPRLCRMLSAQDSTFTDIFRQITERWFRSHKRDPSPWELQRRAWRGLQILGPAAAPARPEIVRLLAGETGRVELWYLLASMGPAGSETLDLLERSFSTGAARGRPGADWTEADFNPQWLISDLRMAGTDTSRATLRDHLLQKTNSLATRVSCLWSLRKNTDFARTMVPRLAALVADPSEPPLLKLACLHALGRLPHPDFAPLHQAMTAFETEFGALPANTILNGDFSQSHWTSTSQMPVDPKPPSALLAHWLTWNGPIGRDPAGSASPAPKLELAPRSPPGAVSQVFRTVPGALYTLTLEAVTGRNWRLQITAGDLDTLCIPASTDPLKPAKLTFHFRARSPLTTLTLTTPDFDGHGPFIDNLIVQRKD